MFNIHVYEKYAQFDTIVKEIKEKKGMDEFD